MQAMTDYKPIDCDFYDHFEIHAMHGTWLEITFDEAGQERKMISRIKTTETKDKEEFAITDNGLRIRMDRVKKLTPLNPRLDMRGQLLDKMDYNYWANQKMIKHLVGASALPETVHRWMCHILNAHDRWNKRILGLESRLGVWEEYPTSEWQELNEDIHTDSYSILRNEPLDKVVSYTNTEGAHHETSIAVIVYHIINHSTYHGGQIAFELRNAGLTALSTDFTDWKRGG